MTEEELAAIKARHERGVKALHWTTYYEVIDDRGALLAEVERLREALLTISRVEFQENGWLACHEVLDSVRIAARAALGGKP